MHSRIHPLSAEATSTTSRYGPIWSLKARLRWVSRFRQLLVREEQKLAKLLDEEIGKPYYEFLTGEMLPLLAACRWHERHAYRLIRPQRLRGKAIWQFGQQHTTQRSPLGHVAIIATWNYPVQLLGIQLIQSIVGGNTVTVKPSERAPRTQQYLLALAEQAEVPNGVLHWTDSSRDAGELMLRSRHFDHIIFTGSTEVGRQIAAYAAQRMITTTLELSGRDSAFVLDDANPELAAEAIWTAVTMNAGQTCMAPRRVLVQSGIYSRFLDAIAPLVSSSKPVCVIDDASACRVWDLANDAVARGARSISGVIEQPRGRMLHPIAMVDCPPDALLVAGDHFGPALSVVPVRSLEDAVAIHSECDQHLATSIFSKNPHRVRELTERLNSSNITVNDCILPVAHPAASIGGSGGSGWGMSQGQEGLLALTRPLHLSVTSTWLRPSMQLPSPGGLALLRRIARWLYGGFAIKPATPRTRPVSGALNHPPVATSTGVAITSSTLTSPSTRSSKP